MYRFLLLLIVSCFFIKTPAAAQPLTDALLHTILNNAPSPIVQKVLQQPQTYRCQIIYTQIQRDKNNRPHFKNYYFNFDPQLYFNPASTVKLPLALLSLERLHQLQLPGIDKYTTILYDSSYTGQKVLYHDTTAASGLPSIAHFIKRAFLISENDPYNRMYEFVGQHNTNTLLHRKGYTDVRITRQFMPFNEDQNRHTNALHFVAKNGKPLYYQPPVFNTDSFDFSHTVTLGNAYLNRNDSLVHAPFDFTRHNNLSLLDLQQLLQSILFPASVAPQQRFALSKNDYQFLYRYLSQYPSETSDPKYDTAHFYDSYVKFFFRDSTHTIPANIRVFNKVGWSYGFLTDVSYVVDFKNKVEFMLSATLYVNSDGVLNDNQYDYNTIGYPFLYNLGQTIYQYELQRTRKYKPDLSSFRIRYNHRDPKDKRPSLIDVDN